MLKTSRAARGILIAAALALPAVALTAIPAWAATVQASTWSALYSDFNNVGPGQSATIQLTGDITNAPSTQYLTVNNNGGSGGANITLDLNGHSLTINTTGAANFAPISVGQGASLTINDTSNGSGHLTVTAATSLGAGVEAAGIGGYADGTQSNDAGTIIINGGVINATGGSGAGIGGYGAGGSVTIHGGKVTASSPSSGGGAGIGGGENHSTTGLTDGGLITITGGEVVATGYNGAGIGGGWSGRTGTVVISGGKVTANAFGGAGIGNGYEPPSTGPFGSVTISGGDVTAESQGFGAGIGGGDEDYDHGGMPNISISGGTVQATGSSAAGIGVGYQGQVPGGVITLSGGTITAQGDLGGAGIGGNSGSGVPTPQILFTGCVSSLQATGGTNPSSDGGGAGLGGGANNPPNNAGGAVTVVGTMASGSSTSGGSGASSSSGGLAPGLGSTLTFNGNPAYLVTTSSSNGAAGTGAGGTFTMSCVVPISALTLTPGFAVGSLAANAPLTLSGQHLQASSAWTATIQSTPVVFANGITNSSGNFSQAANLPASILPGAHIITLAGTKLSSGQISVVLYITVDATGHISYLSTIDPQAGSSLAATGFNAALGVSAIIVLIAAGGVLLLLARRRNTQH